MCPCPMDLVDTLSHDGGCTGPGDVAKASGGVHFVMLGGMLAGHVEGGGEITTKHFANGEATQLDNGNFMPNMKNVSLYSFMV